MDRITDQISNDTFHYKKFVLTPLLKPFISYCWHITIEDKYEEGENDIHVPDGLMELIFVFEGSYIKQSVKAKVAEKKIAESCILGIQTKSNLIKGLDKIRMLGVKFTPLGFSNLFRDKVYATKNENIKLKDLGENWLNELQERLAALNSLSAMKEELSNALFQKFTFNSASHRVFSIIESCVKTIEIKKGVLSVNDLSQSHNMGIRQIQRYFSDYLDITPKQFIDLTRFKYLYKEIVTNKASDHFYLDHGYYDQAHFIKDFSKRTGTLPSLTTHPNFIEKNRIARINLG